MIATVVPETKTNGEREEFSYKIPTSLEDQVSVGSLVFIPFGKRTIRGIVTFIEEDNNKMALKEIKSVDQNFMLSPNYIEIAKQIKDYYLCSFGETISLFLPPEMKRPQTKLKVESRKLKISNIQLSADQEKIFKKLKSNLSDKGKKPALIHGVTGSGKTEIYIKLASEALSIGKQVIVLVPEIILTPQILEKFQQTFQDQVALMHSHLSKSEKFNCFFDFYSGKKPIIVGPRSALLVPSPNVGLIIVDEEQEDSFKQEQNPRYHAVTVAEMIAREFNALLVLGSATPRVETYYKASTGVYDLFTLSKRFEKENLPKATLVDLKDEAKADNYSTISRLLANEIDEVLKNHRQALLFLNRRGVSTFVSCRECGHVILCKNCSIPLVHYIKERTSYLSCHHCGHNEAAPTVCPACKSLKIKYLGAGVDKVASEIIKRYPEARIARIDSTSIKSKHDYEILYRKLLNHEVDLVIGTQMIAKGLDIPNVDLVGIISADTGLHLPHYRASEKSFQLITQVSGRSGRRDNEGKTIIQTYWPDATAIVAASTHDFQKFYQNEISERENFLYPPFVKLIRIISENKDEDKARIAIEKIATDLKESKVDFIGPGPCFYRQLHNRYRFHLIIKLNNDKTNLIAKIKQANDQSLVYDVDPTNLL